MAGCGYPAPSRACYGRSSRKCDVTLRPPRFIRRVLARLAAREPHVPTIRGLAVGGVHADRRRRAATRERANGVIGILSAARRRTVPWPHDLRRGRSSERLTRRRTRLPRLAGPAR